MVTKEHVGQMVWAAWPESRQVFHLKLLGVTEPEPEWDSWYHEWVVQGPAMAEFGKQYGPGGRNVHNPTCELENVFLTEAEARACVRKHCENQAEAWRRTSEMWARLAKEWR